MKWQVRIFWIIVSLGLLGFFCLFNPFIFNQQEEIQLFIPKWSLIEKELFTTGGFYTISGQFFVQFYYHLYLAIFINVIIYSLIGFTFFRLLQRIKPYKHNLFLALIPLIALLKIQLNPSFVFDGALAYLFIILFLSLSTTIIKSKKSYFILSGITIIIYYLLGQLVILYAVMFVFLCWLTKKKNWYYSFMILGLGILLSYGGLQKSLYIPLTDGIYSLRYQETQLVPESFLYYALIRLTVLSFIIFLVANIFNSLCTKKRLPSWASTLISGIIVAICCYLFKPDEFDKQNKLLGELAYKERKEDWDGLIKLCQNREKPGNTTLNYLNMALAQKGQLGEKMFNYNQSGLQGLLSSWNGTYYMSALLSDIHFMIGDISISESYAMEALTLAKRGGSPRILQRLVHINLQKGEIEICKKYLNILKQMPYYHSWAIQLEKDIPNKISENKTNNDQLLSMLDVETLWKAHLKKQPFNTIAFEYLACSFLLTKDIDKFSVLLREVNKLYPEEKLPAHFQEALLIKDLEEKHTYLSEIPIENSFKERFNSFRNDFKREASHINGYARIRQKYGDTYWFYYYCKQI